MSGETKHRISCLEIENAELHRQLADRPWSTVPEDTWALVSFYWKKEKVWYEEGQEWDIGIGRTDDRTSRYVNVLHLDLEDHDAVWQPLPKPYRGGDKMTWQPIETAPKDETILVYGNAKTGDQAEFGQRMAVAKYAMDYNFVNLGSRPLFIYAVGHETKIDKYIWPSHWMPLPKPPEGQK